jgi:hypothetical protein
MLILPRRIFSQWILTRGGQSGLIRVFIDGNLSFAIMGFGSPTDWTGSGIAIVRCSGVNRM